MPSETGGQTERLQEELRLVKLERDDAVADVERLLWLSGLCRYCAKGKGQGNRKLDGPCKSDGENRACEPKWRGPKKRRTPLWKD